MKLRPVHRIELVGFGEGHAEEPAGEPIPERRVAGFVHHPAKLGQRSVAEARAVQLHEQIAASCEQRAPAAGAHFRMEEQAADLGRAFEIGGQAERLVAERLAELRAGLGEGADDGSCRRAARRRPGRTPGRCRGSLSAFGIFKHEHIEVACLARRPRARTTRPSARAWRPASRGPAGRLVNPPPVSLAIW